LVFYLEDENKKIIGRVLCQFTNNKELIRFGLYSIQGLGEKYNFTLSNNLLDIENINDLELYEDPQVYFGKL
jgi:hypothetical protein